MNDFLNEHVLTPNFEYYQTHDFFELFVKMA